MKKLSYTILCAALCATGLLSGSGAAAQPSEPATPRETYLGRYNTLVKNLGAAGVGVETLLDKWRRDYPDDIEQMVARYLFYYTKSETVQVVRKDQATYLGNKPLVTMKDSLGVDVNFFQESFFDDELFGQAIKTVEGAISKSPDRLDLRFAKIDALMAYEKESPDMATSDLRALIDYNFLQKPAWTYPGIEKVDAETFASLIQDCCLKLYLEAAPGPREAFKDLSAKMLSYEPSNTVFMDNMGTYYFVVQHDHKTALKYYDKVLKLKKDDMTAIRNCILLSRRDKNVKLERKYLAMMEKYGTELDSQTAKARLEYLQKAK